MITRKLNDRIKRNLSDNRIQSKPVRCCLDKTNQCKSKAEPANKIFFLFVDDKANQWKNPQNKRRKQMIHHALEHIHICI